MGEHQVSRLEALLDDYNRDLPPLKEFILPGGTRAASLAHLARTVCRRAERALVSLSRAEPVGTTARKYLNRLSDLLFVLGRVLNRAGGGSDVLWQRENTVEKGKSGSKK
jgi:cob(I)alamin adenosyltransferase